VPTGKVAGKCKKELLRNPKISFVFQIKNRQKIHKKAEGRGEGENNFISSWANRPCRVEERANTVEYSREE